LAVGLDPGKIPAAEHSYYISYIRLASASAQRQGIAV